MIIRGRQLSDAQVFMYYVMYWLVLILIVHEYKSPFTVVQLLRGTRSQLEYNYLIGAEESQETLY